MENWEQIEKLVSEALNLDGADRKNYLGEHYEKYPELKKEVESLLNMENEADDFFDSPAAVQFASFLEDEKPEANVGEQIGNYQILRELGTGGMGAVYFATRTDGNLEQKVAIKMLRREFNTKEIRLRFEHEKEIQAALNHPNIAHLIDAGTTKDSIPYLVMEYIEGEIISKYCRRKGLSLNDRLKLFNKVCEAVAFAHRNLVIHRDLKPSNIIVTDDGEPKLLDFGISKLLTGNATQTQTVTKMGVMTPEYASPEQVKGESVTTATDIYSLGIILFELLTGYRPFNKESQDSGNLFKAIIEKEPEKPSDAVIQNRSANIPKAESIDVPAIKQASNDEAKTQVLEKSKTQELISKTKPQFEITDSKLLRGDLDNIILKALRKEPERRYQTVEQFSTDIWRHLDGMPVSARPATFNYRASKFIKRNRIGVVAGALIILAIISGLIATLWQARRAEAQRVKAEKRFNDVRSLANSILFDVYPTVEKLEGSLEARKQIVENAIKYLDSLSNEASDNTELQLELAEAYKKVGDVQGNNKYPNLGDMKGSLESYGKARNLIQNVFEKNPDNKEIKNSLADVLEQEAFVLWWLGDNPQTYKKFEKAIELRKDLINSQPDSDKYKFALADLFLYYGDVPFWENKIDEADKIYKLAYAELEKLLEKNPKDDELKSKYAYCLNRLSKIDVNKGDYEKGINRLTKAEKLAQETVDANPENYKFRENLWGMQFSTCELFIVKKEASEAIKSCPKIIITQKKLVELEPNNASAKYNLAISYGYLGRAFRMAKDYEKALDAFDLSISNFDFILKDNPKNVGYRQERIIAVHSKGVLYERQNKLPDAQKVYEEVIAGYKKLLEEVPNEPRSELNLFKSYADLGKNLLAQQKTSEAKAILETALSSGEKLFAKKALDDLGKNMLKEVKTNLGKLK